VDTWIDREHHLRRRAERVRDLLHGLWGHDPLPHADPQLALLLDALLGDDESGRASGVVVQGDGVTYGQLIDAVTHPGGGLRGLSRLPAAFVQRLEASAALAPARLSRGLAALPDETCGAWELDIATEVVSYDAVTARLLGFGHQGGRGNLRSTGAGTIHHDDEFLVASALEEATATHRPYQVRFRVSLPDGSTGWRASRARPVGGEGSDAARLVGFVAADD